MLHTFYATNTRHCDYTAIPMLYGEGGEKERKRETEREKDEGEGEREVAIFREKETGTE